jgi:NAD(P)-dependent dehydrogenase (short-subunit alcohol dehydrogenase family)
MSPILHDKVVFITGAASGIGKVCAEVFAGYGAKLSLVDIDGEGGEATAAALRERGSEVLFAKADVSIAEQVADALAQTVARWGRLDAALNNAGIDGVPGGLADASDDNFDRVIAVNLRGVYLCMKHEIKHMLGQGRGSIVNVASIAGLGGYPGLSAYVAAKHGVVGLTRGAALEYGKAGIRINALCPGVIRTPMLAHLFEQGLIQEQQFLAVQPNGRLGEPIEVAEAAAWMCSDKSSLMIGHPLVVDGGYLAG